MVVHKLVSPDLVHTLNICNLKPCVAKKSMKREYLPSYQVKLKASFLRIISMCKKIKGKAEVNSEHEGIGCSGKRQVWVSRPCKSMSSPWSANSVLSACARNI